MLLGAAFLVKNSQTQFKDVKHLANEFNEFFTSVGANASIASKKLAEDNCLSQIELYCQHVTFQRNFILNA